MKLLETILIGIIVGAIVGFIVASLTLAFKKWKQEHNAIKEIETYKDKFYVEKDGQKIPFAPYLREQALKNRQVKGGFKGLFKNKQNAEDKFKQEEARVSNSASYYGEPTERVRSSNTSTSSRANNSATASRSNAKKETSDWDFH